MHVVIFEGSRWTSFAPASLSRPVFSLGSGMSTLLEKQVRFLEPTRLTLWVRPGLEEYCRTQIAPKLKIPVAINQPLDGEPTLISSGRSLHLTKFEKPDDPCVALDDDDLVRKAYVVAPGLAPQDVLNRTDKWLKIRDLPRGMPQDRLPGYIWDLIAWNEESLLSDAIGLRAERVGPLPAGPYHAVNDEDIHLGDGVGLAPGVVIDASKGPVIIDDAASIGANSVLYGPCYVGPYSMVMPLSIVRAGTSIGPVCKVGGEVSNSILLGYSNKSHEGFLGDSYLGEWVNLGAGTSTSNLKNTYGPVKVRIGSRTVESDRRFLGSLIGDHVKTAVGTRLMSGSYVGYCSLLASSAIPPSFTPSFTFLTDRGAEKYRPEKAKDVIAQVYGRRNRPFTEADARVLTYAAEAAAVVEK